AADSQYPPIPRPVRNRSGPRHRQGLRLREGRGGGCATGV
ncbi:uncharacterized protein METZ01_LOCUS253780, partial [marine metagenome]